MQSKHRSGGKALSPSLAKSSLSAIGVIGGSLDIDGLGVQVDWYFSTIWSTSMFLNQKQDGNKEREISIYMDASS